MRTEAEIRAFLDRNEQRRTNARQKGDSTGALNASLVIATLKWVLDTDREEDTSDAHR